MAARLDASTLRFGGPFDLLRPGFHFFTMTGLKGDRRQFGAARHEEKKGKKARGRLNAQVESFCAHVYAAQLILALLEELLDSVSLLLHGIPLGCRLAPEAVHLAVLFLQLHKHIADHLIEGCDGEYQ